MKSRPKMHQQTLIMWHLGVIGEGMQISANESEVIEVLWRRLKMKKMLSFPAVTTTKM